MSIKSAILAEIKTTLETITEVNGYNQDVQKVERRLKAPPKVNDEDFPILFIIKDDNKKEAGDIDSLKCQMNLIISGYVFRQDDSEDLEAKRENLENDVEKALMVDERRNGKAIKTQVTKIVDDKGTLEPHGIFDLYFYVEYFQDRNDPSEQDGNL